MKGRKIRSIPLTTDTSTYSLSKLPKDIYMLTLVSPSDRYITHVIKTVVTKHHTSAPFSLFEKKPTKSTKKMPYQKKNVTLHRQNTIEDAFVKKGF